MFLDEQQVGTTPLVLSRVAPGTHAIQIRLAGWETWKGTATAERGSTTQVIANMTHAAYSLVVTSTPPGATVLLDGTAKGVTPLTVAGLKPRNYALVVSLKGYAAISRTVDLTDSAQSYAGFLSHTGIWQAEHHVGPDRGSSHYGRQVLWRDTAEDRLIPRRQTTP